MADREPIKWITINGRHVPIFENGFSNEKYKYINPNKGSKNQYDPYAYNCVKCALAFEANMRGEDTEANAFEFGNPEDVEKSRRVEKAFVGDVDMWTVGDSNRQRVIRNVEDLMEEYGPGSRAILQSNSPTQKHAFNVINDNGNIIYIDPQEGRHGKANDIMKGVNTKGLILLRTDNVDMNEEYRKWAYRKRK